MFSGISWGQFLTFAVPLLVGYGVVVAYLFYRDKVSKAAASSSLVGKPAPNGSTSNGAASVVGKTFEQKANRGGSAPSSAATPGLVCEACGHVHHAPTNGAPRLDSYGQPIVNHPTAVAAARPVVAPTTPLTEDFDPVDGSVDLESMLTNLAQVAADTTTVANGTPTHEVITKKTELLSVCSNQDLLDSEFTFLLASELDKAAPTFGYSAADNLEDLKAAA